jgi:hypothetical protein
MRKRGAEAAVAEVRPEQVPSAGEAAAEGVHIDGFHTTEARPPKLTPLRPDVERVVETLFAQDVAAEFRRLNEELAPVGQRGSISVALDAAESNARDAHALYATVDRIRHVWEMENEIVLAEMRDVALAQLQKEKEIGARPKQITDADVRHKCAKLFSEGWVHQETKRHEMELLEDRCKNLVDAWFSRCKSLQALLAKSR